MKLYRIDKLAKPGGVVIGRKHVLAQSDREAVRDARDSADCPICDVFSEGRKVGAII